MDRRNDTSEDSPKSPPAARVTFAEILQRLDTALAYSDSIGLGEMARKGRFGTYRRQLSKLVDALSRHVGEFPPIVAADLEMHVTEYRAAWSEALELSDTVPYLRTCAPSNVVSKLERVLAGPPLPSDEEHRSSEARNIQFELSFAALLDKAGFRPRLGEHPDVTVNVKGRTFLAFPFVKGTKGVMEGYGDPVNVLQHPSQHVKAYAQALIDQLDQQLHPVPQVFWKYEGDNPLGVVNNIKAMTDVKARQAWIKAGKTIAKYLDLGILPPHVREHVPRRLRGRESGGRVGRHRELPSPRRWRPRFRPT